MRQRRRLDIEGLEARDLLSALIAVMASQAATHGTATGGTSGEPTNLLINPTGTPTSHQQARQHFGAKFSGAYTVGPGRFSSEAQQLYFRGVGGSNQFLHGDTQLRLITPIDPTLPITGEITMFDRNLNSNSSLGLDLVADPSTGVDRFGRPTHLTVYQLDPNISAGVYVEGRASGTVDITYLTSDRRNHRGVGQGRAIVTVRALVYSLGTSFILTNADINPGGLSQGGPDHHKPG